MIRHRSYRPRGRSIKRPQAKSMKIFENGNIRQFEELTPDK